MYQIADESQEVREETTRQLDKNVVKDWNYQVELNQRKKDAEQLQREAYAYNEKQVRIKVVVLKIYWTVLIYYNPFYNRTIGTKFFSQN